MKDVRVRCQPNRLAAEAAEGANPGVTVGEARLEGANGAGLDRLVLSRPHAGARVGIAAEYLDLTDQPARPARLQRPAVHGVFERVQADPLDSDPGPGVHQGCAPRTFDQPAQSEDGDPVGKSQALLGVVSAQPRPLAQELRDADPGHDIRRLVAGAEVRRKLHLRSCQQMHQVLERVAVLVQQLSGGRGSLGPLELLGGTDQVGVGVVLFREGPELDA